MLRKLALVLLLIAAVIGGILWWTRSAPPSTPVPVPAPAPTVISGGTTSAAPATPVLRTYVSNGVVHVVADPSQPIVPGPAATPALSNPPPALAGPTSSVPVVVISNPPPIRPATVPWVERPVQNVFEAQLALARRGISPGSLDGVAGGQTRSALLAFQRQQALPLSGELDAATKARLLLKEPVYKTWTVQAVDFLDLQPVSPTWLGKSKQSSLAYETVLEKVAEQSWSSPNLIRRLNPGVNWSNVVVGTVLTVPVVEPPPINGRTAFVRIELAARTLQVIDGYGKLLAHFPCSIAARVEKRPVGELKVVVAIPDPDYTMNPEVFPESAEAQQLGRKLLIPPGPNNPVGVAWIGLSRAGYGIHGTPSPEQVGRTESHGCFRLANWNARHLLRMVTVETPVQIVP